MDEKEKVLDEATQQVAEDIEQEVEPVDEIEEVTVEVTEEVQITEDDTIDQLYEQELEDNENIEELELLDGVPAKKKSIFEKSIIISMAIVGVAVVVLLVGVALRAMGIIYDKTVVGKWQIIVEDTEEEYNYNEYFVFEKDGTFMWVVDSVASLGTWDSTQVETDEGEILSQVTFNYGGYYSATFYYDVDGAPFKGRTLKFYDESYQYNLNFNEVKTTSTNNLSDVETKVDEKLTGEWKNEENQIVFTFDEDGSSSMDQYGLYLYDGVYAAQDGKFTFTFSAYGELNSSDFTYSVDGDKLMIEDLEFVRVTK